MVGRGRGTSGRAPGVLRRGDRAGILPPDHAAGSRGPLRARAPPGARRHGPRLPGPRAAAGSARGDQAAAARKGGAARRARVGLGGGVSGPRLLGTAEFMSPEQAAGGPVDARSDIYSLGVVGFYVLSGHLPFDGPDAMTVLARHVTDPAPPLASVAPDVSHRLAEVIDRCLAKDAADRFPSAAALADAIAVALRERVTPAVPVRAFLTEGRHLSASAVLYGALASLALPLLALHAAAAPDRWTQSGDVAAGVLILGLPAAVMLARVRRLLAAGYARADLTDALSEHLERRREELAFLYGEGPSQLERLLRGVCYASLAAAVAIVGMLQRDPTLAGVAVLPPVLGTAAATALLAASLALAGREP